MQRCPSCKNEFRMLAAWQGEPGHGPGGVDCLALQLEAARRELVVANERIRDLELALLEKAK